MIVERRTTSSGFRRFVDLCADFLIAYRRVLLTVFVAMTLGFGYSASKIQLDPGFLKMIPMTHPYMQTFEKYMFTFPGANQLMINVHWKGEGDIYNKEFLDTLRKVTDATFFTSGVQRSIASSCGSRQWGRSSKSGSTARCANLFHGQASWQSSQP